QNVILSPGGVRQKSTPLQGVRQSEGAAAVNLQEIRQLSERNRLTRSGDRFQNNQPAIQALYGRCLLRRTTLSHSAIVLYATALRLSPTSARARSLVVAPRPSTRRRPGSAVCPVPGGAAADHINRLVVTSSRLALTTG